MLPLSDATPPASSLKNDDTSASAGPPSDTLRTSLESDGAASCCAAHPELCKSLHPQPPPRTPEVVAFHAPGMYGATPDSWRLFDFDKITAVGLFNTLDPEMLCLAHSKQVRILDWFHCNCPNGDPNFKGDIQLNPFNEPWMLLNSTQISLYVEWSTACVKRLGFDGMVLGKYCMILLDLTFAFVASLT